MRKAPRIALAFGDFASLRGIRSLDLVRSGLRFSFKTTCRIQPAMPRLRPLAAGETSFTPANLHYLTRDTFLTFAIPPMRLRHALSTGKWMSGEEKERASIAVEGASETLSGKAWRIAG